MLDIELLSDIAGDIYEFFRLAKKQGRNDADAAAAAMKRRGAKSGRTLEFKPMYTVTHTAKNLSSIVNAQYMHETIKTRRQLEGDDVLKLTAFITSRFGKIPLGK